MKSPRQSIASHCKSCIYDRHCVGTWKDQVEACTITQCDLYEHRPLSTQTRRLLREKALAMLCPHEKEIALERTRKRVLNLPNLHEARLSDANKDK